jgi:hypothetical protein
LQGLGFFIWEKDMKSPFVVSLCVLLFYCSERDLPTQQSDTSPPKLTIQSLPSYINPGETFFVAVQVNDPQGPRDVESVTLNISKEYEPSQSQQYSLHDDGQVNYPDDGDIVAFDGYFTQKILWQTDSGDKQNFVFTFEAIDRAGHEAEPADTVVISMKNEPPAIVEIVLPDTLDSGFTTTKSIAVNVRDDDGRDDIKSVSFKGTRNDTVHFQYEIFPAPVQPVEQPNIGVYSLPVDSAFAAGKMGTYDVTFEARDNSDIASERITRLLFIENEGPLLSNIQSVTKVRKPARGQVRFLITVSVDDPQSIADIKEVRLYWKKPDGTVPNQGPYFTMYDNGLPVNEDLTGWDQGYRGDETAGDGIYSITGIFDTEQPLGDYSLTFFAYDFVGNVSESLSFVITLY